MPTSELRKRPQLSLRELYQVNWFLGAGLALLATWPAFYLLGFSVLPHLLIAWFMIGCAVVRPQLTTLLPRALWQALPFFLVVLLAVDLRLSVELIPALVRLNILLVLYRCLAFRRKREDLQLIVLSLFLVIIAGVVTVNFLFPFQILLFTAMAMTFLFNITLMEDSRDTIAPKEIWRNFTWRRFLVKIRSCCDPGFFVVAGIAFSSVIMFSILLFVMIPRFDVNNPLPFFGMGRSAQTGFSEAIRFGDVTNIRNNGRVALRVEVVADEDVPSDPYWRMLVLDEYVNGGFRLSRGLMNNAQEKKSTTRVNYRDPLIGGEAAPAIENLWTFYLEGGVARYLPMTGKFKRIRFQDSSDLIFLQPAHVLGTPRANSSLMVYQVENMEFSGALKDPGFGRYTLDYDWYPDLDFSSSSDYRYLNYPDTTVALPPADEDAAFLIDLVEEIGQGEALTAVEFAGRATAWVQQRHSYSMSYAVPPGEGDHVVRWLNSNEPGHCEVFAGALLLICRAAGIPARVVTGFRGGSWNAYENYFMVRNSDAHAWVEIFDGKDSWVRVDPTPGGSLPVNTTAFEEGVGQLTADSSLAAYVDSLRMLWYRRIVSFDQESQFELWGRIRETYGRVQIKEWLVAFKDFLAAWWARPWNLGRVMDVVGLAAAAGFLCLLISFWLGRDRSRLFRASGIPDDAVRRKAGRQLERVRSLPPPRDTADEQEELFAEIVVDLQRLRYGSPHYRDGWRGVIKRARRFARARR